MSVHSFILIGIHSDATDISLSFNHIFLTLPHSGTGISFSYAMGHQDLSLYYQWVPCALMICVCMCVCVRVNFIQLNKYGPMYMILGECSPASHTNMQSPHLCSTKQRPMFVTSGHGIRNDEFMLLKQIMLTLHTAFAPVRTPVICFLSTAIWHTQPTLGLTGLIST